MYTHIQFLLEIFAHHETISWDTLRKKVKQASGTIVCMSECMFVCTYVSAYTHKCVCSHFAVSLRSHQWVQFFPRVKMKSHVVLCLHTCTCERMVSCTVCISGSLKCMWALKGKAGGFMCECVPFFSSLSECLFLDWFEGQGLVTGREKLCSCLKGWGGVGRVVVSLSFHKEKKTHTHPFKA